MRLYKKNHNTSNLNFEPTRVLLTLRSFSVSPWTLISKLFANSRPSASNFKSFSSKCGPWSKWFCNHFFDSNLYMYEYGGNYRTVRSPSHYKRPKKWTKNPYIIHHFYPQNRICIQKYQFGLKLMGKRSLQKIVLKYYFIKMPKITNSVMKITIFPYGGISK